jgi:hypothetical protein
MNSWFCRRAFVFGVLIAALSTLVFSGTASARATVGTFYSQETFTFSDVSICTGLTGTTTNTVTDAGRFVENADGTFHFSGTTTHDYRAVWSHGSYEIHHSPSHFEGNSERPQRQRATRSGRVHGDRRSVPRDLSIAFSIA